MSRYVFKILIIFVFINSAAKSQNTILIPIKPYPGYNFRTGEGILGELLLDNGCIITNKEKFSEYKIWAYPLSTVNKKLFQFYKHKNNLTLLKDTIVKVFAGIDTNQSLHLIVDTNFDNDFSNDSGLTYKPAVYKSRQELEDNFLNFPYSKIDTYTKEGKAVSSYFQLQPYAFYQRSIPNVSKNVKDRLSVLLANTQFLSGSFILSKQKYNLKCFLYLSAIQYTNNTDKINLFQVYITNDKYNNLDSQYASSAPLRLNDSIELQNKIFILKFDYSSQKFILQYAGIPSKVGVIKGRVAKEVEGFDSDSSLITLSALKGKFVLLDFSFEGCVYCIEALPVLNEISNNYFKKDLLIFSIVGTRSRKTLAGYLNKYNISNSISIYDAKWRLDDGMATKYKIGYFPTYILVDKVGLICMREYGIDGLLKIKNYLIELFDNKIHE